MIPAAIMAAAPIAGLIGRIFGAGAKGSADQRMGENQQALLQAQMGNNHALGTAQLQNSDNQFRAGLDLERKKFQQAEPNTQARQALTGSLMERIQPLALSGLSGRVRQSMPQMNSIIDAIGPQAREAGGLLAQRGLSGLQGGPTQFADAPKLNIPPAQIAALKQSGLLEKILGIGGLVGSTVGALGDMTSVMSGPTHNHMSNQMPANYSGKDMYGNPIGWQLPKADVWDTNEFNELG